MPTGYKNYPVGKKEWLGICLGKLVTIKNAAIVIGIIIIIVIVVIMCCSKQDQWWFEADRCTEETRRGRRGTDSGSAGEHADQWEPGKADGDAETASCQ